MLHPACQVLLIESEYRLRLSLKTLLKTAGHTVCGETAEIAEGVQMLRKLCPEVVLLGAGPETDLSGLGALVALHIAPVLYLSPAASLQARVAAEAGAYAVLPRVAEAELILPALEIACARFAERQALWRESEDLRDLLALRKTLDQAKGILMRQHHMSEQEAHRRIQRYAMHKRLTVKSVAEAIVKATGGKTKASK